MGNVVKISSLSEIVLFEDDNLLVINKPPFISSLDERGAPSGQSILRIARQAYPDAQVCHRLDKETSGALIIAKNPETYRFVSMQFEHRKVEKEYHAIVEGMHEFDNLLVDLPILNLGKGNVAISKQEGKPAQTIFNSLKFYKHYTRVSCRPITGRMHQIRIHLASQRAVIAGDDMYGGSPVFLSHLKRSYYLGKDQQERPIMQRFALHAHRVSFAASETQQLEVQAPYPKDFEALLKLLDKFDAVS